MFLGWYLVVEKLMMAVEDESEDGCSSSYIYEFNNDMDQSTEMMDITINKAVHLPTRRDPIKASRWKTKPVDSCKLRSLHMLFSRVDSDQRSIFRLPQFFFRKYVISLFSSQFFIPDYAQLIPKWSFTDSRLLS